MLIFFLVFFLYKRFHSSFLEIRKEPNGISVHINVIQQTIGRYFSSLFPNQIFFYHLKIKKKKWEIEADLPFIGEEMRPGFIEKISEELRELFSKLGFQESIKLKIRFKNIVK